jgi:uncharacterized protein YhaN
MLEIEGYDLGVAEQASDPAVLVAIHINEVHTELFSLPILSPAFSWTHKILVALRTFCEWQKIQVDKQYLLSDEGHWLKYQTAIDQLSSALRGGIQKKVTANKEQRHFEKRLGDASKLEEFPSIPSMQEAVSNAMHALHHIQQTHQKATELPKEVQSAANAAMVGIVWLNGFGGRKKEWELMLKEHCTEQLNQVLDFFVCQSNKTCKTYGSLAKWLALCHTTHCKLCCC